MKTVFFLVFNEKLPVFPFEQDRQTNTIATTTIPFSSPAYTSPASRKESGIDGNVVGYALLVNGILIK